MNNKDDTERKASAPEARAKVVPIRQGVEITPQDPWWPENMTVELVPPYFKVLRGGRTSE